MNTDATTDSDIIEEWAAQLDDAARSATACAQLSALRPISVGTAYAVQRAVVARRLGRGTHTIGVKLGFTSRAKAVQMGVDDVIIGRLTSDMLVADGAEISLDDYVHPRVEPEVAFRLTRDVHAGEWRTPAADVIDAVAPALEIIDSRYRDFSFSLPDVIADNTSASGVVLGPWSPLGTGLGNRGVRLEINGRLVEGGSTAAILGDPLRAVPAVLRMAAEHQIPLKAGTVILAGAATSAVALTARAAVTAVVSGVGRVQFKVSEQCMRKEKGDG